MLAIAPQSALIKIHDVPCIACVKEPNTIELRKGAAFSPVPSASPTVESRGGCTDIVHINMKYGTGRAF